MRFQVVSCCLGGKMWHLMMVVITAIAIAGCRTTSPPRSAFLQTDTAGYRHGTIDWTSGDATRVFYRILEHNGYVGFCAYAV